MKKILIGLAVVVAIIAVAMTMFVGELDGLIADAIETEGTAAIGTSVTVDSVETKLTEGIAIINGLAIANTDGYKAKQALVIESFSAKVDYQTQIIEEIIINEPIINAELIGTRSNFDALLEGMPVDEEEVVSEDEEELVLTINTLQLRQSTVNIDSDKLGQTSFVMENLVLNDLSGTVDELSDQVTGKLVTHITSQIKAFANEQIEAALKAAAVLKAEEKLNEKATEKFNEKLGEKTGLKLKKFSLKRKKD